MRRIPRIRRAWIGAALAITAPVASAAAPATTWNELALRRAIARLVEHDAAGAADVFAAQDSGTVSERARLLEAWAARSVGDDERFRSLAEKLARGDGDVGRWAETIAHLEATNGPVIAGERSTSPADALARQFDLDPAEAAKDARAPHDATRRERIATIQQGLAALRDGHADDAYAALTRAEMSWRVEGDALATLADPTPAMIEEVFRAWREGGADERVVRLNVSETRASLERHVDAALDLRRELEEEVVTPRLEPAPRVEGPETWLPSPPASELALVQQLSVDLRAARFAVARDRRALELAQAAARREGAYLGMGLDRVARERASLEESVARAAALVARSEQIVAQLRALRDEETRRIAARTARALEERRTQELVTRALIRFRAEGPSARRSRPLPPDVPSPADLLAEESRLTAALEAWITTFAAQAPVLLARSHDEIWVPRATSGLRALLDAARAEAARAAQLATAIDAARTAALDPSRHATFAEALRASSAREAELDAALREERCRVVIAAVESARREHARRGEGLLYGASVAAHERALTAGASDPATKALLAEATSRHRAFLGAYPESRARSEVRFRLADALLHGAREDFRTAMTRFLGESRAATEADARALAPFVDYAPALAIYDSLLVDDPAFTHRDAVLFQAGMIRSDQGDDAGLRHLEALVRDYPTSVHAQEARLRLGDRRFEAKDYAGSLVHYEAAAVGSDGEHAAMAMYQAGWARSNLDDYEGAAATFLRLVDHYDARPEAARTTDLRDEAEDHLVQCLARAGGVEPFARLFPAERSHPKSALVLAALADLYREYSRFTEAVAADSTWLARWPESPRALETASDLVATLERAEQKDAARDARLALAPAFREGSAWWKANAADSLRLAGEKFARHAYVSAALHHHHLARDSGAAGEWQSAAAHYETLTQGWPNDGAAPAWRYGAGEAAFSLGRFEEAIRSFEAAAASDTAAFRIDAQWQAIAARDAWYEREHASERLGRPLVDSIGAFVSAHPSDGRVADLLWRRGHVARTHAWTDEAVASFTQLAATRPADPRALDGSRLAAQLLVDREDYRGAGAAYAAAAALARSTGRDSVAVTLEAAVPTCAYKLAEQTVARKGEGEESARLFEDVAARWPRVDYAPNALYRAGASWRAAGKTSDAVRVWTLVAERYPKNDLARDAMLETARAWQQADRPREASRAWEQFATRYPDDADAGNALMEAAALVGAAGDSTDMERIEDIYLDRHPEDVATSLAVLERRARREIQAVTPARPISALLATPSPAAKPGALGKWLALATAHPDSASRELAAQVAFLRGEEARARYQSSGLSLPLGPSLAQKKSLLENAIQEYRSCAEQETAPWNRAAATRIGDCLVAFGDALMTSERPADLGGDDLLAYDQEIERKSWEFFDRGEEVWTDLVRRAGETSNDAWVEEARRSLYPRIARRFSHRPEVDFPLAPVPALDGENAP